MLSGPKCFILCWNYSCPTEFWSCCRSEKKPSSFQSISWTYSESLKTPANLHRWSLVFFKEQNRHRQCQTTNIRHSYSFYSHCTFWMRHCPKQSCNMRCLKTKCTEAVQYNWFWEGGFVKHSKQDNFSSADGILKKKEKKSESKHCCPTKNHWIYVDM